MQQVLFEFSIYTIAHRDKLAKVASRSGATKFSEAKAWKTGYDLWNKARSTGAAMPVMFGDAADCSRLLYWGILTGILIEHKITQYSFRQLRKITGRHSPQELLLRTGKAIAVNFIRPYAICQTPSFLTDAILMSPSTLGPATMSEAAFPDREWKRFTGDLAICLADLSEDEFLVLSSKRLNCYIQFAAQGKFGMRVEATSNTYLETGKDKLSTDAYAAMEQLGWKFPAAHRDGSPNFFVDLSCPIDFASLAELAVKSFRNVYNAYHPGELQYKSFRGGGGPDMQIRFPTLRIKREE